MKIISCLESSIPDNRSEDIIYLSQYTNKGESDVGYFGLDFKTSVRRAGLAPSNAAWDFATFALTVAAIDKLIARYDSADGWTRVLNVEIHLISPEIWLEQKHDLEELLRFLTGDFWSFDFQSGGSEPPHPTPIHCDADCISLLSGGMDSLVGAIDLSTSGKKPLFISHIVNGSTSAQSEYASQLNADARFFQWSFDAKLKGFREKSTRGRSMVFYAFAAVASSAVRTSSSEIIDIFVPENGFISLNIALSPGRLGSLSTKTTHPLYMTGIQDLWDKLSLPLALRFPYRFKTKGEMLNECSNQDLLHQLINQSVSCGKYIRRHIHCGVCVPCLVRRGAFNKVGWEDTTEYSKDISVDIVDNISVAASAYLRIRSKGVRYVIGGALNFATGQERKQLEDVFSRGLTEIYDLLHYHGRV